MLSCENPTQMDDPQAVLQYVLAGNATFTLKSRKTGDHRTYRVQASDKPGLWFVSFLAAPDQFRYLGVIRVHDERLGFKVTAKSYALRDTPSAQGFCLFFIRLTIHQAVHPGLDFLHQGSCGRCGRALTEPESIASGIGPICAAKLAA